MKNRIKAAWICLMLTVLLLIPGCESRTTVAKEEERQAEFSIPEYEGEPYVTLNGNEPKFSAEDLQPEPFEFYSELDENGRCGVAEATIGKETMPTKERESISQIEPSGWQTVKYDVVEGDYLYNRCHLIGYQLTAENANERNLITGTRYLNVEGMLPFENIVAEYIEETDNHVRYRVTPVFEDENLVASGVQMEAESIEDKGEGVSFNVYVYNVQPGVEIDYATGESTEEATKDFAKKNTRTGMYILNTSNKKIHKPNCSSVAEMKEKNKKVYNGNIKNLKKEGYEPCGRCKP